MSTGTRGGGDRLLAALCGRRNWPLIDVTRRSIEETAAAILDLYRDHRLKFIAV
jgi:regulator of PEP synthase PpsR (kinase-PPPase family)